MNYQQFLTEKKLGRVVKAAEKKAKDEMSSKGADRKSAAADEASKKNAEELSKWGKAVWDVISKMNPGAAAKDTFNQAAADGTLQAAVKKGLVKEGNKSGDSSLHDWFSKSKSSDGKPGWVQLGGKYAGKPCARQEGQTTKPKCGSSKMKRDLNKDEEQAAFRRKNKQDPNPNRSGKAKNVATEGFTYDQFMSHIDQLDESSLSRIVSKVKKGGTATISAERGDKSKKENKRRSKKLEKDLRGRGLGLTKARGAYNETDHGEVEERSYIVTPGKKGKRKFKKAISKLGAKYDQDSVLIKQRPGLDTNASWLGTSDRKGAEPKKGKKEDQGKMSTRDADKPLNPGEGGTKIKKKKYQFK